MKDFYTWVAIGGVTIRILVAVSLIGLVVAALIKYITS